MSRRKKFNYEEEVINVLLNTIKKYQVYLTRNENIPQLAKLGTLYNELFYIGRRCYGYGFGKYLPLIRKMGLCEDNPKYKIEMCKPKNDYIDELIYGAWTNSEYNMNYSYDELLYLILDNSPTDEFTAKLLKKDKTLDEWVEILTDERYPYTYKDRKSAIGSLLCMGSGDFNYSNGYIRSDADIFGDYKKAKLYKPILNIVLKILDKAKPAIEASHKFVKEFNDEEKRKKIENEISFFGCSVEEFLKKHKEPIKIKEEHYYGHILSRNSRLVQILKDENSHSSYKEAAVEVLQDILYNKEHYSDREGIIEFVENILAEYNQLLLKNN